MRQNSWFFFFIISNIWDTEEFLLFQFLIHYLFAMNIYSTEQTDFKYLPFSNI